jgi:hypothetical protein
MSEQVFKYREASEFDFSNAPVFRKTATLQKSKVRIAEADQVVVTVINDKEETRCLAKAGDYVVTGPKGEEYVIKAAKFSGLYVEDAADATRYISRNVVRALVLTEDTELTAPWGERQRAAKGGVAAQRVDNKKDIYLIDKAVFESTYTREAGNAAEKTTQKL